MVEIGPKSTGKISIVFEDLSRNSYFIFLPKLSPRDSVLHC